MDLSQVSDSSGGASGKEDTYQRRRRKRCKCHPWVGKIPWRRAWQPTPVFLPGESHGLRNLVGYIMHRVTQSQTGLKQLSLQARLTSKLELFFDTPRE